MIVVVSSQIACDVELEGHGGKDMWKTLVCILVTVVLVSSVQISVCLGLSLLLW